MKENGNSKAVNIRIEKNLFKEIKRRATTEYSTISGWIMRAIVERLARDKQND